MKFNAAKQQATSTACVVILLAVALTLGFVAGFYEATGVLPTFHKSAHVLPPSDMPLVSTAEIQDIVSPVQDREYGEGYNCIDYAWEAARLLQWKGQPVGIVRLALDPGPDHAILLVATEDKGWIFIEPQNGVQVKPTIGGKYAHLQTIQGIYVMEILWTPIGEYIEAAAGNQTGAALGNIGDEVADVSDLREALLAYGAVTILQVPLVLAMMFMALWKRGWIRTILSLCIVTWGAYYITYDMKMAAPLIAVGTILFIMSVFTLKQRGEANV